MGILSIRSVLGAFVVALMLAGCASNKPQESAAMTGSEASQSGQQEAPAMAPEQSAQPQEIKPVVADGKLVVPTMDGNTKELTGVFYFDLDQAIIKPAAFAELNEHADALKNDPALHVRLEGNTDERGTREYNLALGERRANAVRNYLVAQGVSSSQIEVISYGEEKPVSLAHNEAAWALNRRVQIVYK